MEFNYFEWFLLPEWLQVGDSCVEPSLARQQTQIRLLFITKRQLGNLITKTKHFNFIFFIIPTRAERVFPIKLNWGQFMNLPIKAVLMETRQSSTWTQSVGFWQPLLGQIRAEQNMLKRPRKHVWNAWIIMQANCSDWNWFKWSPDVAVTENSFVNASVWQFKVKV